MSRRSVVAVVNTLQHRVGHCVHSLGNLSMAAYASSQLGCGSKPDLVLLTHPIGSTEHTIASKVIERRPDVCGFSATSLTEPTIIRAIEIIKYEMPECLIVVGGPSIVESATVSRFASSRVDLCVNGDGEQAFALILDAVGQGAASDLREGRISVPGVYARTAMTSHLAPCPQVDLSELPSPYCSPDGVSFFDSLAEPFDHVYWETARGCVFRCVYCAYRGRRSMFRCVPEDRLLTELRYFAERGVKSVFITDPVLGGPKARTKKVLSLIGKQPTVDEVAVLLRGEYLDAEMIELLKKARVTWLDLGLQTTNPALGYIHRANNISFLLGRWEELRRADIGFNLDLILGFPGDTVETMKESLRFVVEQAHPTTLKVFTLRVYPGTALHDMATMQGNRWLRYNRATRLVESTFSCSGEEMEQMIKFGNSIVAFYRYLESKAWYGAGNRYRSLDLFEELFSWLELRERSSAAAWHVLNFPQNSYSEALVADLWDSYCTDRNQVC